MAKAVLVNGGTCIRLPLPSELDMRAATGLMQAIAECRGRDVELDGSLVSRLGGQCLQVIIAAVRDWVSEGRNFSIVSPSTALIEHLEMLGVQPASQYLENAA